MRIVKVQFYNIKEDKFVGIDIRKRIRHYETYEAKTYKNYKEKYYLSKDKLLPPPDKKITKEIPPTGYRISEQLTTSHIDDIIDLYNVQQPFMAFGDISLLEHGLDGKIEFDKKCNSVQCTSYGRDIDTLHICSVLLQADINFMVYYNYCSLCRSYYVYMNIGYRDTKKSYLLYENTLIPKRNIQYEILQALIYIDGKERKLLCYTDGTYFYVGRYSKYELMSMDRIYENYREIIIFNKYTVFYYEPLDIYMRRIMKEEKENDQKEEDAETKKKTHRYHGGTKNKNNQYIQDNVDAKLLDFTNCVSLKTGQYCVSYVNITDKKDVFMTEETVNILDTCFNRVNEFFTKVNKNGELYGERDVLNILKQKYMDMVYEPLTQEEQDKLTLDRRRAIEQLSLPITELKQSVEPETQDIIANKKNTYLRYGLTENDFAIIRDTYNFDVGNMSTDKPFFFTHNDYNLSEKGGINNSVNNPINYPRGFRPEMRIVERTYNITNDILPSSRQGIIEISKTRPLALGTRQIFTKLGLIHYVDDYARSQADRDVYIMPAYFPYNKYVPIALKWTHELNKYAVQKLINRDLMFSIIYFEPNENEMDKYFFVDCSKKHFLGCILIRIRYCRDKILYVFTDKIEKGWRKTYYTITEERILYVCNFRSNIVELRDTIYDNVSTTYRELQLIRQLSDAQEIHIYRIGDNPQYLISKYSMDYIRKFYEDNNLSTDELNILVEVVYDDNNEYNYTKFKLKHDTKDNSSITMDEIRIVEKIVSETKLLDLITTHMRNELKTLYEFVKIYARNQQKDIIECLPTFFVKNNIKATGSIGMPTKDNIVDEMNYLVNHGNIREVLTSLCTFVKSVGFTSVDGIRGCKMLWDLYLHTEQYNGFIFNYENINARKEELRTLIGYELSDVKLKIEEGGAFPDWCNIAIPFIYTTHYLLTSTNTLNNGRFASDMRPLKKRTPMDINDCHKNLERKPIFQYSDKEMIQLTKFYDTDEEKRKAVIPGECYYKPNNVAYDMSWNEYEQTLKLTDMTYMPFDTQMRNRYNKPSIGLISGHSQIVLELLMLFKPISFTSYNIYDAIKRSSIISLALIIWIVPPRHHSINEILQAAYVSKMYYDKTQTLGDTHGYVRACEYDIKKPTQQTVDELIQNVFL